LENKYRFTRILAADCYWLSGQHENLVLSMLHFLSLESSARIFAIAGFHTGRARLVNFFEVADEHGLEPDEIYEEDDQGVRREWIPERNNGFEDHTERKKWLVISRLKRKGT
jgi:nicotinamide N-methyltransferase